jgi:hypothetical protein
VTLNKYLIKSIFQALKIDFINFMCFSAGANHTLDIPDSETLRILPMLMMLTAQKKSDSGGNI